MPTELIPAEVAQSPEAIEASMIAAEIEQEVGFLTIDSNEMYDLAGNQLRDIATRKRKIEEHRVKLKAPILEAGRALDAFFAIPIGSLQRSEDTLKQRMAAYYAEQQARIRDAQEAAIAEQRRVANELRAQAEATETAAVSAADPDEAVRLAEQAEMQRAEADQVQHTQVVVATEVPASSGVSVRENWQVVCDDINALIEHCAKTPNDRYLLAFNEKDGGKLAKASKGSVQIPGLRFFNKGTVAARSKGG